MFIKLFLFKFRCICGWWWYSKNCEFFCCIIFLYVFNELDKRWNELNFVILLFCFNKCGIKEKDKVCVVEKIRLGCLLFVVLRVLFFNVYKEWISLGSWFVNIFLVLVRVIFCLFFLKRGVFIYFLRDCIWWLNVGWVIYFEVDVFEKFNVFFRVR